MCHISLVYSTSTSSREISLEKFDSTDIIPCNGTVTIGLRNALGDDSGAHCSTKYSVADNSDS